jgi:hypothetical protein
MGAQHDPAINEHIPLMFLDNLFIISEYWTARCLDWRGLSNVEKYLKLAAGGYGRRKNLGYLWAIQHGAQEVYETDDDNELITADLPTFDGLETYVYNVTNQTVVNPYAYFGYPEIWPRGYPLDQIRASQHSVEHFSRVASKPLILQGLADKDPDVDAIFRYQPSSLPP